MGTLKDYKRTSGVLGALYICQKIHNNASASSKTARNFFKNTQSSIWLISTTVDAASGVRTAPTPDQLRFYAFCSVLMNESPLPRLMRDSEWLDSDSPAPVTWSMVVTVVIVEWRI